MYGILLATNKPQSRKQPDKEIIVHHIHHNQQEDRFPENPFDVSL